MEEKKFENKMYWYHWVAIYAMIGSAIAFWVIPEKSLWAGIVMVAIGIGSYLVITKLPRKDMRGL